jgi:hypothetical protein
MILLSVARGYMRVIVMFTVLGGDQAGGQQEVVDVRPLLQLLLPAAIT